MPWYEILMWIPSVMIVFAFIPQLVGTIKTKKTEGLSSISYSILFIGTFLIMSWAGFAGITFISIYISNLILIVFESIIMFYIFKNINKLKFFYALEVLFTIMFVLSTLHLIDNSLLAANDVVLSILMFMAVGSVGFSFAPQIVMALIKKEVGYVSIATASLIAISNLLFFIAYIGKYVDTSIIAILIGGIGSFLGMAWQIPQIGLKIYLDKKKKA